MEEGEACSSEEITAVEEIEAAAPGEADVEEEEGGVHKPDASYGGR